LRQRTSISCSILLMTLLLCSVLRKLLQSKYLQHIDLDKIDDLLIKLLLLLIDLTDCSVNSSELMIVCQFGLECVQIYIGLFCVECSSIFNYIQLYATIYNYMYPVKILKTHIVITCNIMYL
jgi:hypothetical protein